MATQKLNLPWHQLRPTSLQSLRADLEEHYPTLHVSINEGNTVHVSGLYPVHDADGKPIDQYEIRLDLPFDYPKSLPSVYETGGRIPWTAGRHVNPDGTACVMMPEERPRIWPVGEPLSLYLNGPLRNFFLGQLARDHGDPWPFGEWAHGEAGFHEFVQEQIGSSDLMVTLGFLNLVHDEHPSYRTSCPCRSGRLTRDCCRSRVVTLRRLISRESAAHLMRWLITTPSTKGLQGVAGTTVTLRSWNMSRRLLKTSTVIPETAKDEATQLSVAS